MSDQYKALTRKYRPVHFEDIVSQQHVSSTLKNAIEGNRLSHAYLFCGPRGVGKTTMARVLARTINEVGADVDGEALSQTLNILEVDAASNNKVEDAHRIRDAVRVPPQTGRYKIFIIDEVHMLSKAAFNALLKTLEEPPSYAIFIFATTEPHKVLPTILSRVQRFDFKPISVPEIVERLRNICTEENIEIDDDSLHMISRKAEGALRDALGLLDQVIALCGTTIRYEELMKAFNAVSMDRLFTLTTHIEKHDTVAGVRLVSDLLQEGHDIQEFLMALTEHFRNMLLARDERNMYAIETSKEVKKQLHDVSQQFSEDDIMRMLHIVHEAQFKIRDAHQPRILLEMTILKLIKMERSSGLGQLFEEIKELKAALASGNGVGTGRIAKSGTVQAQSGTVSKPAQSGASATMSADEDSPYGNKADDRKAETSPASGTDNGKPSQGSSEPTPKPVFTPQNGSGLKRKPGMRNKMAAVSSESVTTKAALTTEAQPPAKPESAADTERTSAKPAVDTTASLPPENAIFEKASATTANSKAVYLHSVKSVWDDYIKGLKEPIPSMVRLSMESVQPSDLNGKVLTLSSHDHFIAQMVEEHQAALSSSLEAYVGHKLRIRCVVKQTGNEKKEEDPYTRFKKLQEKDPRIKTIVDVFGAELEW
ncbi:MAG: DNA polymerase III subunit gamma/tau [Balneolia bacterium]|nr:DNA polymerase III subunit gamma/tau [Balneolia bacterium]